MSTDDGDGFDPEAPEQAEIGREMVDESTGLGSVMAHFYRGEMDRETTWRQRLDDTTNWAVTVIAAVVVYGFSANGTPEILLAGIVVTALFLWIEARRFQHYSGYRYRIRVLQENLFANALDPSEGVEDADWRRRLSRDLREPREHITYREALGRRLRRIYFPLLVVLLAAWLFRLTSVESDAGWTAEAAIGPVPGVAVLAVVGAFYLALAALALSTRVTESSEDFDHS